MGRDGIVILIVIWIKYIGLARIKDGAATDPAREGVANTICTSKFLPNLQLFKVQGANKAMQRLLYFHKIKMLA